MSGELWAFEWTDDGLALVGQTALPQNPRRVVVRDVDTLVDAIQPLLVHDAPVIGAAGGYGGALALLRPGWKDEETAGPTAVLERIRGAHDRQR